MTSCLIWVDKKNSSSRSRAGHMNAALLYYLFMRPASLFPLPRGEGVRLEYTAEGSTVIQTATVPYFVLPSANIEKGDKLCPLKSSFSSLSSSSLSEAHRNRPVNSSFQSLPLSLKERLHSQPANIYQYEYERLVNLLSSSPGALNASKNGKKNDGRAQNVEWKRDGWKLISHESTYAGYVNKE